MITKIQDVGIVLREESIFLPVGDRAATGSAVRRLHNHPGTRILLCSPLLNRLTELFWYHEMWAFHASYPAWAQNV